MSVEGDYGGNYVTLPRLLCPQQRSRLLSRVKRVPTSGSAKVSGGVASKGRHLGGRPNGCNKMGKGHQALCRLIQRAVAVSNSERTAQQRAIIVILEPTVRQLKAVLQRFTRLFSRQIGQTTRINGGGCCSAVSSTTVTFVRYGVSVKRTDSSRRQTEIAVFSDGLSTAREERLRDSHG